MYGVAALFGPIVAVHVLGVACRENILYFLQWDHMDYGAINTADKRH